LENITCEDCLELLVGIRVKDNLYFHVEKEDSVILSSLARQVFKGIALTDRQFDLAVRKLEPYKQQFIDQNIDIDDIINNSKLRMPFREIDREHRVYITHNKSENLKLIVVKFPFNKKLIDKLQTLREKSEGQVTKSNNKWKFPLTEQNVLIIGNTVNKFDFDDEFKDLYEQISNFDPKDYVPGIYYNNGSYELKNVHPDAVKNAQAVCGDIQTYPTRYLDRAKQYGITYSEYLPEGNTLSEKISLRSNSKVNLKDDYSYNDILTAINELNRFPVLVIVDDDSTYKVNEVYNSSKKFVKNTEQSVMFRLPNDTEDSIMFNSWVREQSLNNWVDEKTKVVFIEGTKVPKPVLKNYKPQCILNLSNKTRSYGTNASWLDKVDLHMTYRVNMLFEVEKI